MNQDNESEWASEAAIIDRIISQSQ
jgi:hypothetical protein